MICRENNDLVGMGLTHIEIAGDNVARYQQKGSSLTSDWRSQNTLFRRRALG